MIRQRLPQQLCGAALEDYLIHSQLYRDKQPPKIEKTFTELHPLGKIRKLCPPSADQGSPHAALSDSHILGSTW